MNAHVPTESNDLSEIIGLRFDRNYSNWIGNQWNKSQAEFTAKVIQLKSVQCLFSPKEYIVCKKNRIKRKTRI